MLASTAAASVWIVVWACAPLSVPLRIASRSSRSWPSVACVGCAPAGRSPWRSVFRVSKAVWTAEEDPAAPGASAPVLDADPLVGVDPLVVDDEELDSDWMAAWTAPRSAWIWLI